MDGRQGWDFFPFSGSIYFGAAARNRVRGGARQAWLGIVFIKYVKEWKAKHQVPERLQPALTMWEWGEGFRTLLNSPGLQLCVWLSWMWSAVPSPWAKTWKHLGCRSPAVVPVGPALGRDDAGRWGFLSLPLDGKGICAWRRVSSLLFSWEINRIQLWSYSMPFPPEMKSFLVQSHCHLLCSLFHIWK